jgi:hypothetical protein
MVCAVAVKQLNKARMQSQVSLGKSLDPVTWNSPFVRENEGNKPNHPGEVKSPSERSASSKYSFP